MKINWLKIRSKLCVILGHNFICLARHKKGDVTTMQPRDEYTAWMCARCNVRNSNTFDYTKIK